MASLECCSRTVVAHFSETPSVSSSCYIWSHHGHCQAVSPDYWTQFQHSYSLTSCPCQVRGLFHNQCSTKPLFLLWGKKVNTAIVVAEVRHCKAREGWMAMILPLAHLHLCLAVLFSRILWHRPYCVFMCFLLKKLYKTNKWCSWVIWVFVVLLFFIS